VLLWNRESSLSERFPNEAIRIEVNLPIMLIATVRAHSQQRPGGSELQDLYVRRGLTQNVRNLGQASFQKVCCFSVIHIMGDLRN
jgi:hypothetical protein